MSFKSVITSIGDATEDVVHKAEDVVTDIMHINAIEKLKNLLENILHALPFDPADKANFQLVIDDVKEIIADVKKTYADTATLIAGAPSVQDVVEAAIPTIQSEVKDQVDAALATIEASIADRVKAAVDALAPPVVTAPPETPPQT